MRIASTFDARVWIVRASLLLLGGNVGFLTIAPATPYPLSADEALRLIHIIVPLFAGYLAAAARYVTQRSTKEDAVVEAGQMPLLQLLVKGPLYLWTVLSITVFTAFAFSHRQAASASTGMSVETLATLISLLASFLASTTGLIVATGFRRASGQLEPT